MTGDAATAALRSVLAGNVADALSILSDHVLTAENPRQAMFVIAAGYASVAADDDLRMTAGMIPDDADLLLSLVAAVRSDDLEGGWMLWQLSAAGSLGAVLGGLLAVAALSASREVGL